MKRVICYQTQDGRIFTNECTAIAHDEDCFAKELDGLLLLAGIENRHEQWRYLTRLTDAKNRAGVVAALKAAIAIHEHGNGEDDTE